MNKLKMRSENLVDENIEFIAKKFPNAIVEARDEDGNLSRMVDFDVLKQELLSEIVESDKERYQMTWPGKKQAILTANAPVAMTLRPCKEESVDFDNTKNIYIEGDNLDVLKVLRETYLGKVKMIYIDPPYNTGNDFVYNDDFATEINSYLEKSSQVDNQGNKMTINNESNGRFHSDWLNMIYPRLKIAKDLLSNDGIIFISIDDNEQSNLRKICDELFGAQNFITMFIWEKTQHFGRQKLNSYSNADYILCYAKSLIAEKLKELLVEFVNNELQDAPLFNASNNVNTLNFPKGSVKFNLKDGIYDQTKSADYILLNPVEVKEGTNLNDFSLKFRSRWSNKTVQEEIKKGTTFWVKTDTFAIRAIYGENKTATVAPKQIIFTNSKNEFCAKNRFDEKVNTSEKATNDLNSLMSIQCFSYPKPVSLIKYFISLLYDDNKKDFINDFIVLDFFSGSATTAQAVLELNLKDKGKRKFILIQMPEDLNKNLSCALGPAKEIVSNAIKICDQLGKDHLLTEIGKERIRRVGKKIKEENPNTQNLDIGFKVFKLDSSNMKDTYYEPSQYTTNLLDQLDENIKPDRTPEDLLFQVMLDLGLMLDSKIEEKVINNKKVFIVGEYNEVINPDLICCFDSNIDNDTVKEIASLKPRYAVFRDSSMAKDSVAVNFDQIFETYSASTTRKVL